MWKFLLFSFIGLNVNFGWSQNISESSYYYTHKKRQSAFSWGVKPFLRIFIPKNSLQKKLNNKEFNSRPAYIPKRILKKFSIDTVLIHDRNVFILSPKDLPSQKTVLYLHGGAYVNSLFRHQWLFAGSLIQQTNCKIIIPDYPLAPSSNYTTAIKMIDSVYLNLLSNSPSDSIVLMGDSAGGGLVLAWAQNQDSVSKNSQIILISPWLDVTMSNPEITDIKKKDPILNSNSLKIAGISWAGNTATNNPLVSPIYGSFENLGKISVFIGTHDILAADCHKLKTILEHKNIPFNYFEYPKMLHDWVMYTPMKESKFAVKQISQLINKD
jgi:acetyl esterase/lipase